ncbi:hypothetical protein [uncultured Planococcus sp.]|uniref:hypothetical protein n=1 Tax=uncultured Planococcus sp. TaxID=337815 RepID=UPI0026201A83|nr:hypothetical protein [uncultured Planococcus sp.]
MEISLSRRLAKVFATDAILELGVRKRLDISKRTENCKTFDDLPDDIQTLVITIEKAKGWKSDAG